MLRLGVLLLLLVPIYSAAQSVSANVTITPNFTFNNTTALEAAAGTSPYTLITGSFIINVNNGNNACKVYAALQSPGITTGTGTPMAASIIKIKFNVTDAGSDATGIVTADIPMTTTTPGTQLFAQKKKNTTYHYTYDVKLPLMGYIYAPGTYNYTFLITMTIP